MYYYESLPKQTLLLLVLLLPNLFYDFFETVTGSDFMLTRTSGRAFFSDSKQCVSSFSLPKAVSPNCFAALLDIVFPTVRSSLIFFLDGKVVLS